MSPVIQGLSYESVRVEVGYNLMGGDFFVSSTTSGLDTTSVIDTSLKGGADDHNGWWVVATSGSNDGEIRRVTDDNGAGDLTVDAFGATVPSGMTYELWHEWYPPAAILRYCNQAIIEATGKTYDPEEDVSLHSDGKTLRFDIPSQFAMLNRIEKREAFTSAEIHACNRIFDERKDDDFGQEVDTEDYKRGSGSLKITIVTTSLSAGDFMTDSITSVDLSGMTHLEGWVKASTTLAAGDFVIRLDDGAVQGNSTDKEVLSVPATTKANTWTYFRVALANPENDTAIASVGLEYNANPVANTVWFDDIKAVNNDSSAWKPIDRHLWRIDRNAQDLIMINGGASSVGYRLLKLIGGDKPALFTADSSTNEVDDNYVINYATGRALMASRRPEDPQRAQFFLNRAEAAKQAFPFLSNVRQVI